MRNAKTADVSTTPDLRRSLALRTIAATILSSLYFAAAQAPSGGRDKYQWLEDAYSARATAWVKQENERTVKVLETDPHFASLQASALLVLESKDRLPRPNFHSGEVYNTWQDAAHVRGILRRTSLSDYLVAQPHWQTILDYDLLAKGDKQNWVQHGADCLFPGDSLCLVALSVGGEDAYTGREFDLRTAKFVTNGFVLPRSKQNAAWVDRDTILLARDWGNGTMTKSGYPFVVKLWKRGQPLSQATEVFRARETDIRADPATLFDASGHHATFLVRSITFFEQEYFILTSRGTEKIALPSKANINDLVEGQVIVTLDQDWKPAGQSTKFVQGSVVSLDLEALKRDPAHLRPIAVFTPTAREFVQDVDTTKSRLLVTTLENVQGRAYVYTHDSSDNSWRPKRLDVPDKLSVSVATTNKSDNKFFLSIQGFLNPRSLWLGDAEANTLKEVKTMPPQFTASDVVEQFEAVSKDSTKVPYFVVHPKQMKCDGSNPALMTAYGGFELSMTPEYSAVIGKLWLERGGVYVLANIRGGGEFGPAWHEAGLKTHRQRIYDDFAAVAQDLISRKITSSRRLGIQGGSNGGLLMGVEMTQHPEMWNAVVIEIPLLDMLRYEQIDAGASWVGEYGSVSNPEERAFLASISPYNQLKKDVTYPEPLIFTTTKDDRVGPGHARKFAAKMQELGKPFFFYEIVEGGHGSGANLKEDAKTDAVEFTYLTRKLMK